MRFLLYLLWSLISILVVVLVSATLLLAMYDEKLEDKLVSGIEAFTKRDIQIQGGLGFYFNPWPTFVANDIRMANSSWSEHPWMLEVDALKVSLSFSDLLRGDIYVQKVEADNALIWIESDPLSGEINWYFSSDREPKPLTFMAEHFRVENARINNADIRIRIGKLGHDLQLDVTNGQADPDNQIADIQAIGTLDKAPLDLNIKLTSLRSMFMREPTTIRFVGEHGRTLIQGNGAIADLLRWQGHDIQLSLQAPTLLSVQSWVETRLIDTPPLQATASFVQPGKWPTARLDAIEIQSNDLDGETLILGSVRKLRGMEGIDLRGEMYYPLASIMRWKGKQSSTDTQLDAQLRLYGNKKEALHFEIVEASLKGQGVNLRSAGKINDLLQADTEGIEVSGSVDSVSAVGRFTAQTWFESPPLDGRFEIHKKRGRLALQNVDIRSFGERAQITGTLDDITSAQQGVFQLTAKLQPDDVKQLNQLNDLALSVFASTDIQASIDMQRTDFSAPAFKMTLNSPGLSVVADGPVSDLKTLHTTSAEISLNAEKVADINRQFGLSLPELGHFKASGIANGDLKQSYDINNIEGTLTNKEQTFSMLGEISQLGTKMKTELTINSKIHSIDNVIKLLELDIDIPGELRASGRAKLRSDSATDWSFDNILLKLDNNHQGVISGSVAHFPNATDYQLDADFRRMEVKALLDNPMTRTLKTENASAYMEIRKTPDDLTFSLQNIDGQFNMASGEASVKVVGSVDDIAQLEGMSLQLGLSARELREVPYLSAIPFRPGIGGIASATLKGNLEDMQIGISSLNMADTDISGELELTFAVDQKPRMAGQLYSKNLDILALLEEDETARLFSDTPVDLDWINLLNLDLDFRAQRLNGIITELNNASLSISIENGVLNAPNLTGAVGIGRLTTWVTLDARNKPYSIVIAMLGDNISPERVNLFGDSEIIRGGQIEIDVGLAGGGTSIAEFMSNAYGKIQLELLNSSLKNQNLELFGADLFSSVLNMIDLNQRKLEYLPIECGVIHFPVVNGDAVASQGIAIKTDRVTVLGGGVIDFNQETMELIIRPKARKGLGFSAGTLANVAKIAGPFENPRMILNKSALVQTTAAIGIAVASGGWSLLAQGLLDRNVANSDVCTRTRNQPNNAYFNAVAPEGFNDTQTGSDKR